MATSGAANLIWLHVDNLRGKDPISATDVLFFLDQAEADPSSVALI